ncbi:hypothetical protein J1N35_011504 [Gossypium stocksii]|uniref:Uncharacterized protein n=1 Tax=Gossypium stocksii TaxID=47602 RepID=A0A9D3W2M5_9ROSI|nr:hypothetical protein J1N35_011504 [Gossypium stocksii]
MVVTQLGIRSFNEFESWVGYHHIPGRASGQLEGLFRTGCVGESDEGSRLMYGLIVGLLGVEPLVGKVERQTVKYH